MEAPRGICSLKMHWSPQIPEKNWKYFILHHKSLKLIHTLENLDLYSKGAVIAWVVAVDECIK